MDLEYIQKLNNHSITKSDLIYAENLYSQITTFDPTSIAEIDRIVGIVAPTGSGKTVLIKDILSKIHTSYDKIYVFSQTAKAQKVYNFIPNDNIIDHFDEELLVNLWEKHKALKANNINVKLERILIILDDVINEDAYLHSKILPQYATASRHYGFSIFLLSQNFSSIKPIVRNNISVAICFSMDSQKERAKFTEQFLSTKNNRVGSVLYNKITKEKPFQCIVIESYKVGVKETDKIKKYVADSDVPSFKVKSVIPKLKKNQEETREKGVKYSERSPVKSSTVFLKDSDEERIFNF